PLLYFSRLCPLRFLFPCSRLHRNLHSFPTRRSSDLPDSPGPSVSQTNGSPTVLPDPDVFEPPASGGKGQAPNPNTVIVANPVDRSEEHTSELQSRENLVCRLLLEKKKKIKRNKDTLS